MKIKTALLVVLLILLPSLGHARCRTVGESAGLGTEYGTFPMYPATRLIQLGEERKNPVLQWVGYGVGLPLFVVALPFGMAGAGVGTMLHPWTKCMGQEQGFGSASNG